MIDARYHVISLVAVFLALGIGILLGTTLVERGLIAEQKNEIKSLRQTFDEIQDKNKTLNDQVVALEGFANETKAYLLAGHLTGRSFGVVTGEFPSQTALDRIYEVVGSSGGSVAIAVSMKSSKVFEDPNIQSALVTLFALPADQPPDPQALKERVYQEIATQFATASNPIILDQLATLGVLSVNGAIQAPVSGAIVLGPIEDRSMDRTDIPLIRALTTAGLPVLGVGDSNCLDSVIMTYKREGLSTVDHVETVPGQVALVMVLSGRPGNYGSGKAANRVLPEPAVP